MVQKSDVSQTVSVDKKGRLVLPKKIRAEAHINVERKLVARAAGIGRVELFDPVVLDAKAQEIGKKKLLGWREEDHDATGYAEELVRAR
jgi:bifunctional DNA-binding transcriptional regulator/antitoxin component of YhaV-PrlF toxin-antitoxin module